MRSTSLDPYTVTCTCRARYGTALTGNSHITMYLAADQLIAIAVSGSDFQLEDFQP